MSSLLQGYLVLFCLGKSKTAYGLYLLMKRMVLCAFIFGKSVFVTFWLLVPWHLSRCIYRLEPVLLRATFSLLSWELNGLEWQTESHLCKSLIGSIGLAQSYNPRCLVFNLQKADYSCLGGHQICYKERGAQSEVSQSTSCFRVKLIEFQRS